MRLICVPSLFCLISLISLLFFHITHAVEFIDTNSLQQQKYQQSVSDESNIDDTSLFRGVENAIDEDTEGDDAYRIFKSLQDVSEDDFSEEDEEEAQQIEHSSSKDIKSRIQPEEEDIENDNNDDNINIDDDDIIIEEDEDEEDDEEDDEEEDDEEDFSADSFPEFKNEAAADFFEHLPQKPFVPEGENGIEPIQEEDDEEVEDDNVENHIDVHDNEEDDEDEDDSTSNHANNLNNNINIGVNDKNNNNNIPLTPILPPPSVAEENTIPWHRPDSKDRLIVNDHDNKFNQESNYNSSFDRNSRSATGFRFWHGMFILLILVIIIKSSNRKKSHHVLDSSNTSLPWSKDEKDYYLPLHNSKVNSRYYHNKWEIKSS